jgi:phage terminase large subunit-like protein
LEQLAELEAAINATPDIPPSCQRTLETYCPHPPWPKQQTFLGLDCQEAFYGGGAGPGKTDALLMAALQYVHVPGYSALILRRDYKRLGMPGSIMDRARSWLYNSDASWNGSDYRYRFPSGASIQFGYIDSPDDRFRYASAEFQFIGYDELTEFQLSGDESNPYLFMFSRLRKPAAMDVPLRIRSASNPGNIGHQWVKDRFMTPESLAGLRDGIDKTYWKEARAFVPALLKDNPAINPDEYLPQLKHLPPVTRARLLAGDWSVREDSLIKPEWLRYYEAVGGHIALFDKNGERICTFAEADCQRFATADTAGTSEDKAKERKGKPASWSVIAVWLKPPTKFGNVLILRHVWRRRVDFTDLLEGFRKVQREWTCKITVESKHFGPAVYDMLRGEMQMGMIDPGGKDKVTRAADLLNKLDRGEVYLPKFDNDWKQDLEAEWLGWTGHEDETSDQVDVAAYAAIMQSGQSTSWGGVVNAR